jgi:hypothetical protein
MRFTLYHSISYGRSKTDYSQRRMSFNCVVKCARVPFIPTTSLAHSEISFRLFSFPGNFVCRVVASTCCFCRKTVEIVAKNAKRNFSCNRFFYLSLARSSSIFQPPQQWQWLTIEYQFLIWNSIYVLYGMNVQFSINFHKLQRTSNAKKKNSALYIEYGYKNQCLTTCWMAHHKRENMEQELKIIDNNDNICISRSHAYPLASRSHSLTYLPSSLYNN